MHHRLPARHPLPHGRRSFVCKYNVRQSPSPRHGGPACDEIAGFAWQMIVERFVLAMEAAVLIR
jgi:hypothetical protein